MAYFVDFGLFVLYLRKNECATVLVLEIVYIIDKGIYLISDFARTFNAPIKCLLIGQQKAPFYYINNFQLCVANM